VWIAINHLVMTSINTIIITTTTDITTTIIIIPLPLSP
jgi:hypothetical protein